MLNKYFETKIKQLCGIQGRELKFRFGESFLPGFLNMSTSDLDWKQNIIHQLKLRNKREKEPFENLVQSCECVNSVSS
jgi:hypothetical protein